MQDSYIYKNLFTRTNSDSDILVTIEKADQVDFLEEDFWIIDFLNYFCDRYDFMIHNCTFSPEMRSLVSYLNIERTHKSSNDWI
jgi:hypothetical protein